MIIKNEALSPPHLDITFIDVRSRVEVVKAMQPKSPVGTNSLVQRQSQGTLLFLERMLGVVAQPLSVQRQGPTESHLHCTVPFHRPPRAGDHRSCLTGNAHHRPKANEPWQSRQGQSSRNDVIPGGGRPRRFHLQLAGEFDAALSIEPQSQRHGPATRLVTLRFAQRFCDCPLLAAPISNLLRRTPGTSIPTSVSLFCNLAGCNCVSLARICFELHLRDRLPSHSCLLLPTQFAERICRPWRIGSPPTCPLWWRCRSR